MYRYNVDEIILKNGDKIAPKSLTVFVGPNNCGKSKILKEILELSVKESMKTIILEDIRFQFPASWDELVESYGIQIRIDKFGNHIYEPSSSLDPVFSENKAHGGIEVGPNIHEAWLMKLQQMDKIWFKNTFGNFSVGFLGTEDRLNIIRQAQLTPKDMPERAANLLQALYEEEPETEDLFRSIIKDAFNVEIKLDYSYLCALILRIGDTFGEIPEDPRRARPILKNFDKLDDQGDGLKSFVATVLAMLVSKKPVLLIDEPEAFLHPPQARKLGELIAQYSRDRQIFIATHSSDLLSGILAKREDLTVIRIDRQKNDNIIHILDHTHLTEIVNHPLLSSSRILEALFYKGTVIAEADSDSTFYQRISRIVRASDDIHYVHAHSKQAIHKVAEAYTKLGIRFSAIVDFDALRVQDEFKHLFLAMNQNTTKLGRLLELQKEIVEEIESVDKTHLLEQLIEKLDKLNASISSGLSFENPDRTLLNAQRELKRIREDSSPWCNYKASGCNALTPESKGKFLELDRICRDDGLFLVPVGELESWLIYYGVDRSNKSKWIVNALTSLHEIQIDENEPLGKFIIAIHKYLLKEV